MSEFREVTGEEFSAFMENYPRPLSKDIARRYEPALFTANDFSLGNWPESIVAKASLTEGEAYYDHEPTKYYIKVAQ